jgi:hypothetical protein
MDPRLRHLIYFNMGFRLIDFPYVMPPLGPGKPKVYFLLLLVFITHKIPFDTEDESLSGVEEGASNAPTERPRYLPGILLQRFFADQWQHAEQYGRLNGTPGAVEGVLLCPLA